MKVTVLGSGGWGTALALLLLENGNDVTLWSYSEEESRKLSETRINPLLPDVRIPEEMKFSTDMACVKGCGAIVMATPSFAVRATAAQLRELADEGTIIISVSKGIEKDTSLRLSQIIEQEVGGKCPVVVLSGPSHAEEVGRQAALQGYTLVSGNARGADRTAQAACLKAGGKVISIVADELEKHRKKENVLYLSEDGFSEPFSSQRALSRNRCIHALGRMVFVAQSNWQKGGTWDGTAKNLHFGWSPVACYRDGSEASLQLEQMGAYLVDLQDLRDMGDLKTPDTTIFDMEEKEIDVKRLD